MMRGVLVAAALCATPAAAAPSRIMSINLCADQLVLALVPPERIASVSHLARDCRISVACAEAATLPVSDGTAEEMVATQPDLIVAGKYTTRSTVAVANHFGFPVMDLDVPTTIPAVREQMQAVADAVGSPEAGKAMVAQFDRDLNTLPPPLPGRRRPVAAVYETNGFVVGQGSLIDTLLNLAGFDNLAARLDLQSYTSLPLENLVSDQPDLLIVEARADDRPSLGGAMLEHPVLKAGFPADRFLAVPQRLWICAGPMNIEALKLLSAARHGIEGRSS